jgi:hypothetical protein
VILAVNRCSISHSDSGCLPFEVEVGEGEAIAAAPSVSGGSDSGFAVTEAEEARGEVCIRRGVRPVEEEEVVSVGLDFGAILQAWCLV